MSRETLKYLNTNTLIGNTAHRGTAWHYRAEEQGEESNHYPGPIPRRRRGTPALLLGGRVPPDRGRGPGHRRDHDPPDRRRELRCSRGGVGR
jgi:hypothetical protein